MGKVLTSTLREWGERRIARTQLDAVTEGLLEVIADELARAKALLEPGGMTLVEVSAKVLGDPGIGDVTNEAVVKAERVVSLNGQPPGADQALAKERRQSTTHDG
jgi:hypothetical protein